MSENMHSTEKFMSAMKVFAGVDPTKKKIMPITTEMFQSVISIHNRMERVIFIQHTGDTGEHFIKNEFYPVCHVTSGVLVVHDRDGDHCPIPEEILTEHSLFKFAFTEANLLEIDNLVKDSKQVTIANLKRACIEYNTDTHSVFSVGDILVYKSPLMGNPASINENDPVIVLDVLPQNYGGGDLVVGSMVNGHMVTVCIESKRMKHLK